jgi:hypothetical protein
MALLVLREIRRRLKLGRRRYASGPLQIGGHAQAALIGLFG